MVFWVCFVVKKKRERSLMAEKMEVQKAIERKRKENKWIKNGRKGL